MKKRNYRATIQLDRLIFSCRSTIDDNFTDVIIYGKDKKNKTFFLMRNTTVKQLFNYESPYKYVYEVSYKDYRIGILELGYKGRYSNHFKFTVDNTVFYNGTFPFLLNVMSDLNLKLKNLSYIEIAIDNYIKNSIKRIYNCIVNERYKILLNRKSINDMDAIINEIVYWHKGSRRKPNQIKTIIAKSKKKDKTFDLSELLVFTSKLIVMVWLPAPPLVGWIVIQFGVLRVPLVSTMVEVHDSVVLKLTPLAPLVSFASTVWFNASLLGTVIPPSTNSLLSSLQATNTINSAIKILIFFITTSTI